MGEDLVKILLLVREPQHRAVAQEVMVLLQAPQELQTLAAEGAEAVERELLVGRHQKAALVALALLFFHTQFLEGHP